MRFQSENTVFKSLRRIVDKASDSPGLRYLFQVIYVRCCLAHVTIFCLHYTTELTLRLRHGRVGQPGPRYILIVTMNLQQSG